MRCPYCNKNTIPPFKKFINKNIKCNSCGRNVQFSNSKRGLAVIAFIVATYFNNMITEQEPYKSIIFFSLVIVVIFSFMIIPIDLDKK